MSTILLMVSSCSVLENSSYLDHFSAINNEKNNSQLDTQGSIFSKSGTIVMSFPVVRDSKGNIQNFTGSNEEKKSPTDSDLSINLEPNSAAKSPSELLGSSKYAPLVGFVPVHASFQPADNEVWMELERETSLLRIYKGKEKLKEIKAQGKVTLAPGEYPLQHKQKAPLWYAPDEYFEKRQLKVPPRGDHFRYRRGALGAYALYPTMEFIIHSGPFGSEEIGGLKVSDVDLAAIFMMINVGSPVVIK